MAHSNATDNGIADIPLTGVFDRCPARFYTSCNPNYYLTYDRTRCKGCPVGAQCPGGTAGYEYQVSGCGDYAGSLYQKLVQYALQTCVRSGTMTSNELPYTILADINTVMDSIKSQMGRELAQECERLGGVWIATPLTAAELVEDTKELEFFYSETSSNRKWGHCQKTESELEALRAARAMLGQ